MAVCIHKHRVRLVSSPLALQYFSHTIPTPAFSYQPDNSIFLSHHSNSNLQLQPAEHGEIRNGEEMHLYICMYIYRYIYIYITIRLLQAATRFFRCLSGPWAKQAKVGCCPCPSMVFSAAHSCSFGSTHMNACLPALSLDFSAAQHAAMSLSALVTL